MGRSKKQSEIIISIILLIIIIPAVSSLAFKQGVENQLKHAVRLSGGIPPPSVTCNLTVSYPNNTVMIDFKEMERASQGQYYNYTLNENHTSTIGTYNYDITCLSGNLNKTESFQFYVNPGGIEPSQTKTDTVGRTIYIMAALGLIFFVAFLFSREGNPTYKYTYLIISFMFFLVTTNFLFISLQDDVVNPTIQQFFSSFTAISFYILLFLGFILATLWIIATFNTIILKNNEKEIRRFGDGGFEP